MNISDRLDRIEARLKPDKAERIVFWIHFVSPGELDRPATRIQHGERAWHRADGETEEAFRARALSEVEASTPANVALQMLID